MPESRLEYLFNCYVQNTYTVKEEEELMVLLAKTENQIAVQKLIDHVIENTGSEMQMNDQVAASILQNIMQKGKGLVIPIKNRKTVFSIWKNVAAVAILFLAGAAYWIFDKKVDTKDKVGMVAQMHSHILPGGNRAVLTTSDGSTIILDSIQNGTVLQKGGTKISKQGGLLIYNISASIKPCVSIGYNTLTTPRGGQYQIVLADGSKVWLNAASSLHFPTAFSGNQRVVEPVSYTHLTL